ncbi:MAG: hypothetical protein N2C12_08020, partial [Planctomycetales bacterium]
NDAVGPDHNMSNYVLTALLDAERDEAWKETATALATAWNKRFGKRAGSHQPSYGYNGGGELVPMLKLNLILENEKQVGQMLRLYEQQFVGNEAAFALLVRYGRHSMAAKLLRTGWNSMSLDNHQYGYDSYGNPQRVEYDQKMHEVLPKFLETLAKKDLRFLAEVILAALPDATDQESKPEVGHGERLVALANRFSKITFEGPAIKEQTLVWLSTNDNEEVLKPISGLIEEIAKTIDLGAVMQLDNHQLQQRKQKLFMAYLTSKLQEGNYQPVLDSLNRLEKADVEYDYEIEEATALIGETVTAVIIEKASQWEAEEMAAVLPTVRRFAAMDSFNYSYRFQNYPSLNIALHILAGQSDQLSSWWKGLPEEKRPGASSEIWSSAATLVMGGKQEEQEETESTDKSPAGSSEDTLPRRLALAKGIFKFFQSHDSFDWLDIRQHVIHSGDGQGLVNGLIYSKLLSQAELLEHGPAIAAETPLNGLMWAALADVQLRVSNTDAAVKSYKKAIAATPDEKPLQSARLHMNQARLFNKYLKQPGKARTLLESFDKDKLGKLDPADKKEFDVLLKEMKNSK